MPGARETAGGAVSLSRYLECLATGPALDHHHLVLGESTSLVRADDGGAPQRLHRRQLADQGVAAGHTLHAQGQANRYHRRESFGHGRDGQAHRCHEEFHNGLAVGGTQVSCQSLVHDCRRASVARDAEEQDESANGEGRNPQPATQLVQVLLQGRGVVLVGLEHLGDEPYLGVHSRGGDQSPASAVGRYCSHEGRVSTITQWDVLVQHHVGILVGRHRLAGQGGFLDSEVDSLDQAKVGRHVVARFQHNYIAGHNLAGRHRHLAAIAQN